jgi:uncharacterized repeat protein (TIGR03803 family)
MSKSGKITILRSFAGGDGCQPEGGLVMEASGNMYGVTTSGGSADDGTVYKITKTGTVTTLHSFTGQPDGASPLSNLAMDKAGNFCGTTPNGGNPNCTTEQQGCDIVFKIDTHGNEHILHSFLLAEGGLPYAGVFWTLQATFTARLRVSPVITGIHFQAGQKRDFTKLHDSTGGADGGFPFAAMTLDKSGTFYGTTYLGGMSDGSDYGQGCGVVFQLTLR